MRHDPRALLVALAATLDGGEVLARFPGLSRDELRGILREAARLFPDGFARLPAGHTSAFFGRRLRVHGLSLALRRAQGQRLGPPGVANPGSLAQF